MIRPVLFHIFYIRLSSVWISSWIRNTSIFNILRNSSRSSGGHSVPTPLSARIRSVAKGSMSLGSGDAAEAAANAKVRAVGVGVVGMLWDGVSDGISIVVLGRAAASRSARFCHFHFPPGGPILGCSVVVVACTRGALGTLDIYADAGTSTYTVLNMRTAHVSE